MAEVMLVMQIMMKTYAHGDYYPYAVLKKFYYSVVQDKIMPKAMPDTSGALSNTALGQVTPYEVEIIANHPGDLRNIKNYFIYGGILIWLVTFIGFVIKIAGKKTSEADAKKPSSFWLWGVGVFYLVVCGYLIRTAPDARFFLPALPFILLPLCENVVQIKFRRQMLVVFSAIALLQYGAVLTKTFSLRNVSDAMVEGMNYLQENKPSCSRVFMYPEGNYRLFPCSHEWYLGYKLREFWKADNDTRIQMLKNYHVGAIVVKKHLISSVDEKITNLGVYPDYFVKGLENDDRFKLVFDNSAVAIYTF